MGKCKPDHIFPLFSKVWGKVWICVLMYQAIMAYCYPDRIFGNWRDMGFYEEKTGVRVQLTYNQFRKANWFYAARQLTLAAVGKMGLMNPMNGMHGCVYVYSAFWILSVITCLGDALGQQWFMPASMNNGQQIPLNMFIWLIVCAIHCFALSQIWHTAYPETMEMYDKMSNPDGTMKKMEPKKNHMPPMFVKVWFWLMKLGLLSMSFMLLHTPEKTWFWLGDKELAFRWLGNPWMDMMVVLIGVRMFALFLLGCLAWCKRGCQLRFMAVFFLVLVHWYVLDGIALMFVSPTDDMKKMHGAATLIMAIPNIICIHLIHKTIKGGAGAGNAGMGNNQVGDIAYGQPVV